MTNILTQLADQIGERPVGTTGNRAALDLLTARAQELGFQAETIPLACQTWRCGESHLEFDKARIPVNAGPFSPPTEGVFPACTAQTVAELERGQLTGSVVFLHGELAAEPLMPKEFPFYYPEEHKRIIDLLEHAQPAAVVTVTGKHPMCGLHPFPVFEDGAFTVPNAYVADDAPGIHGLLHGDGDRAVGIAIDSSSAAVESRQPVFRLPGADPAIVVCAHVDTKYGTPGAIDNAAGVAAMFGAMERLQGAGRGCRVEFVPFNGEEYFGVAGQLAYLADREPTPENTQLVINLDGLGYRGSQNAFSCYNADDRLVGHTERAARRVPETVRGEEWIAGDHSIFAFAGIRCVAVTSSTADEVFAITHTAADTTDLVDPVLIEAAAEFTATLTVARAALVHPSRPPLLAPSADRRRRGRSS